MSRDQLPSRARQQRQEGCRRLFWFLICAAFIGGIHERLPAQSLETAPLNQIDDSKFSHSDLIGISDQVETVYAQVTDSVIAMEGGSGVIVSPDGWVLTAAHVSQTPGRRVKVRLANGIQWQAETYGNNRQTDIGMVKLLGDRQWPFLKLASDAPASAGQWAIALGFPWDNVQTKGPAIRLGRVSRVTDFRIVSDIPVVGGDSGGPLLSLDGRVIGIHSRIRLNVNHNIHIPIQRFIEDQQALMLGAEIRKTDPRSSDSTPGAVSLRNSAATQTALQPLVDQNQACVARITRRGNPPLAGERASDNGIQTVLGTVVSGSGLVVTKYSQLQSSLTTANGTAAAIECQINGERYAASLVASDRLMDLALLQVTAAQKVQLRPIRIPVAAVDDHVENSIGQTLVSAIGGRNGQPRALSMGTWMIQMQDFQAIADRQEVDFGVLLDKGAGLFVNSVFPNSLAQQSGLKPIDRIETVGQRRVTTAAELQRALSADSNQDQTSVSVIRSGQALSLTVDFPTRLPVIWDRWGGGPFSQRRFGFGTVIAHDGFISPADCGGPVLDLAGNTVGINISRAMRNVTYAVPIERVLEFVRQQRPNSKLGRESP